MIEFLVLAYVWFGGELPDAAAQAYGRKYEVIMLTTRNLREGATLPPASLSQYLPVPDPGLTMFLYRWMDFLEMREASDWRSYKEERLEAADFIDFWTDVATARGEFASVLERRRRLRDIQRRLGKPILSVDTWPPPLPYWRFVYGF